MPPKRKELVSENKSPVKNKRIRQEKTGDYSDDEDLSDIDDGGEVFNGIRIPAELPPIVSAEENSGPRMVIKEIVANNFKSYYGEVTVGPFHKSLTSIVGANGSGKSNVIDSLLFVFGYRSTKIRSKKVSVLLHKSDRHKDVCQCSVTVHFVHIRDDDTQETGFVAIPGTEITITRTAFKDNTSFYTLNNKRVKFKDIATILKTNGIDLKHNRFLILQGEVEQIAMMKPKAENEHSTGMLEYLEDVIGTVRYKKPIEKLDGKVKDLSLEKNEKITRMKYVLKERDELEDPAKEVIRYIKMENVVTRMANSKLQKEMYDINQIASSETETKNKITDELSAIKKELKVINEREKNKEKILRDLTVKLNAEKINQDSLTNKLSANYKAELGIKTNSAILREQLKKYENSIKQEQKKITKANDVPKAKEAERERLKSQLASLEKECPKLEAEYTKINSNGYEKSKKFREEKDDLVPEESNLRKLVGSKTNQLQALKTEFDILLDTEKSEKEKLNKLEDQLTRETDEFEENMRQKEKAEIDVQSSRDAIKDMERSIEKLKNDEQQIKTNLQNIRQSLNEKRTAYAETTGRSRPIEYILTLKDKNEVNGILGRCGDYGRVEDKYDIPASTACGSTDQIVVESSDAAHACIQRLRTNNIGRLTFSILPQVQKLKPRADAKNSYPENATRVFDCIEILDQRFRLTFYSGLHDTLLASNIEQARRIAFNFKVRYRVVTFKGDLIDQSGIMSGGGRPIKGKIGPREIKSKYASGNTIQVSQNEVEKLAKHVKDLEAKLKETQSKIFDIEVDIREHRKQIEELNVIIRRCSVSINGWKEQESKLKHSIKDQKLVIVQKKTDPVAVAKKEAEIKKAEKELEDAKVNYDKIKSKVDELKKKINEITVEGPKEAKRLLDEATTKLQKTRSGINQVGIDIVSAERQIKLSEDQINTLTNNINETKAKIESNEEMITTSEKLTEEMRKKVSELNANIKEQEKFIEDTKNKNDEDFHRSNELEKNEVKLKLDFDEIKNKLEKTLEKLKDGKSQLSRLQLKPIPKISYAQRDPLLESYQNRDAINQNKVMVDKENNKEQSEKLTNYQKIDCLSDEDLKEIHRLDIENSDTEMETELYQFTDEQLKNLAYSDIVTPYFALSEELKKTKPNFSLLDEYIKRTHQYNEKADEVAEVLKLYNDHVDMINKVRQRRRDEFMASFRKITIKLKEMYQMITLGGDAELELVDSLDPFSEGVNFSVRPPKKTWKVISNLSGGEKTLSSLALVFALHYYKPSPLYVMDEIDAALDFKNVSIIAYYIKERTKNSQFIIISLRSNMFEKANLLVGIYKTNDCTETASVTTNEYKDMLDGKLAKYSHQK